MSGSIIDRVTLQLQFDESVTTEKNALEVAESLYYDYMLPSIQRVMDEYEDLPVIIEDVSLDLGRLAPEDVPCQLEKMLREAIERNIQQVLAQHYVRPLDGDATQMSHVRRQQNTIDTSWEEQTMRSVLKEEVSSNGSQESLLQEFVDKKQQLWKGSLVSRSSISQQLRDFISKEQLPWTEEPEDIDAVRWWNEQAFEMLNDADFVRSLYEECRAASALYRLLSYTNDELLAGLLVKWLVDDDILPPTNHFKNKLLIREEQINHRGLVEGEKLVTRMAVLPPSILRLLLTFLVRNEQIPNHEITDIVVSALTKEDDKIGKSNNIENNIHTDLLSEESLLKKASLKPDAAQLPGTSHLSETARSTDAKFLIDVAQMYALQKRQLLSEVQSVDMTKMWNTVDQQPLYYSTEVAGLVLLHPFLTHFFRRLQLLNEKDQFLGLDEQLHAVHLLRHLTGKAGRHQSHLLNVEKILCGLSPQFPVPEEYEISDDEKKEASDLYEAVKQYWKTVSDTSVEGIQKTFIHRDGIISFEEPYWVLRVESSAFDILMDDLPWELSILILPWADHAILIEWQREY